MAEGRRARAPDHRRTPEHDRSPQDTRSRHAVGEHAERKARRRSNQRGDRDEQADIRVVDAEVVPELDRRGTDSGGVGASERQNRREQQNHARPLLPPEGRGQRARACAPDPSGRGRRAADGPAARAYLFGHRDFSGRRRLSGKELTCRRS